MITSNRVLLNENPYDLSILIDINTARVIAICFLREFKSQTDTRRIQIAVVRLRMRLIYDVLKTSVKRSLFSKVKVTSMQYQRK